MSQNSLPLSDRIDRRTGLVILVVIVFSCWSVFHFAFLSSVDRPFRWINLPIQQLIYLSTLLLTFKRQSSSTLFGIHHFRALILCLASQDLVYDSFYLFLNGDWSRLGPGSYLIAATPYIGFLFLSFLLSFHTIYLWLKSLHSFRNAFVMLVALGALVAALGFSTAIAYRHVFFATVESLSESSKNVAHLKSVLIFFSAIAVILSSATSLTSRGAMFWIHFGLVVLLGMSLVFHDEELTNRLTEPWMVFSWEVGTLFLLLAAYLFPKASQKTETPQASTKLSFFPVLPLMAFASGTAIYGFRLFSSQPNSSDSLRSAWSTEACALLILAFLYVQIAQWFTNGLQSELKDISASAKNEGPRISKKGLFMGLSGFKSELETIISNSVACRAKIFISYSRKNPIEAEHVDSLIRRNRLEPLRDDLSLTSGEPVFASVKQLIEISDIVVALHSKDSVLSTSVSEELGYASQINKKVIYISLDDADKPDFNQGLWLPGDSRNAREASIARIVTDHFDANEDLG